MAEVGILNLQIKDNSETAAKGLIDLGNAYLVLKNAVGDGIRLSGVATQIKKLAKVVDESLGSGTIATIERFCNSISKLNGLGNININLKGADKISRTIESIETGKAAVQGMADGFSTLGERVSRANAEAERFNNAVRETNELMQNTNWSWGGSGFEQFQQMMDILFRARSMALGAGEPVGLSTEVEKGWTLWKEGAIEVEGTVRDASEGIAGYLGEPIKYLTDTASQLGSINDYIEKTDSLFGKMAEDTAGVSGAHAIIPYSQISEAVSEATQKRLEYTDAIAKEKQAEYEAAEAMRKTQEAAFYAEKPQLSMGQTNAMADNLTQLDLLKAKLNDAYVAYNKLVNTEGPDSSKTIKAGLEVQKLRDQIWEYQQSLRSMTEESTDAEAATESLRQRFDELMFGAEGFTGALKRMFPQLSNLLKRFGTLVKYRMLRSVIKHISEGFSEGVQNVYQYSKAVGTSLAPAMDSATSALAQMKNSIGAAAAPLIQTFIPYIKMAVSAVIEIVNWLNQFFALLRGQSTWTRALPVAAEAFDKQKKSAKGASAAMKDLLADWDELNIIQSQSGGGGAGSSAKDATDYASMFEEVSEFDESVKDAIKFIEDHLGGIPGILKKAGAILLGWKLSKAFGGLIGALGKIIAGGAIVTLGVELAYGGGFEAGTKGYFDAKDLIASVAGTIATALGGSLITTALGLGGGAGFLIGLTAGLIVTLVGWINGQADMYDRMKWGNQEMTPEQIKNYVASKFSFDVNAEIELLGANIKNREDAEAALTTAVNTFTSNLTFAKMKVGIQADDAETALTEAYTSANNVIKEIQSYIDTNEKSLYTTLSVSPIKDSKGNDVTSDILESVTIADTTLKSYFVGLGKELADAMYEGEKDGWTEGETEAVLALMERQRNIVAKAEEMQRDITFEMNYRFNLNNLTRDNAKEISEQQQAIINDYKETFMKDRQTALAAATKELAWAQAALDDAREKGLDTTDLESAVKTYQSLINDYMDPQKAEEDWNVKMSESMANMREDWLKALRKNYGIMEEEFEWDHNPFTYKLPNTRLANDVLDAAQMEDPVGQATKALKQYFDVIKKEQPDYIRDIMSSLNIGVWDITNDTIKKNLVAMLRENLGNDDWAAMVLQNVGISVDEIEKLFGDGYKYLPEEMVVPVELLPEAASFEIDAQAEIGETGLYDQLKQEVEDAMKDGIMSTDEAFDLMTRYGWQEYENAMKELQYNLDEYGANRGMVQPMGMLASAGTSDVGFARKNYAPDSTVTLQVEPGDNQQEVNNTANGVRQGTETLLSALNSILAVAQAINRKQFVVNLVPTSGLGRTVAQGAAAFSRVTGVDR